MDSRSVAPMEAPDIAELLGATWLTRGLTFESRRALARLGRLVTVAASETLLREGDPTESMAIVVDGRIGLRLYVPERGHVTILTVEPGDVVGWSALVAPFRATSTAVALERSRLIRFEGEELRHRLAADSELALAVYPLLLEAVARRLEGTRLQLLDLFTQRWVEPW